jgi:ATP-binding cassette, subfamily F, member 2
LNRVFVCFNFCQIKGNYDQYVRTRGEQEENQMKIYKKEQDEIADIKQFVARFGHGTAKMVRQAQSREKVLKKMEEVGLTQPVETERARWFKTWLVFVLILKEKVIFYDPTPLSPPVISLTQVSFGYSSDKMLYRRVDFGVDLDSRISIVGPNGAGKSTLLKLILGELTPSDGTVQRHSHLVIGHFHQHLSELLDPNMNPLDYMLKHYPMEREAMRRILGRYGINGVLQTRLISSLSGGQKARLNLAW